MSSRGSSAWLLQRVTGALLFITLGSHFFLYHYFMGPGMWSFDSIGFGATDLATLKAMLESNPEDNKTATLSMGEKQSDKNNIQKKLKNEIGN